MRSHRDPLPHDLLERADIAGMDAGDSGRPDPATTPTTPSTPVIGELPTATALPVDALPVVTRRFVREAAAAIGCPPDLVAVPLLATLSAGIGASRVVQLKPGWQESATLYMATVSSPGSKKTPAAKAATTPAWRKQSDLKKKYREEHAEYEAEFRAWEAKKRESMQCGDPPPEPPDEPTMGRTVVEDSTVEALATVLEPNPRGVLNAKDELSGWARAMNQYKSGKGSDRQFWLSAWSKSPTSVDRKGRAEPIIIPMPFVSVVGTIQPGILPELADDREDGLLDRFLFAYPEPHRSRLTDDEMSTEAIAEYTNLYEQLAGLDMMEGESGEPVPRVVTMTHDAWEVFKELHDGSQDEMNAPGFPARLEGVWSKMEAYLARLSLILALCRVAKQGGEERVEAQDVLMALGLVDYFKAHARRVHMGLHGQDAHDLLAVELAEFLQERGGEWKDEPNMLHEALKKRKSEAVPERPDELGKMVYAISRRGTWLKAEQGWKKNEEGQSRRAIHLCFRNGVDGVVGVDHKAP
jgi:putative DNA primase/helicase